MTKKNVQHAEDDEVFRTAERISAECKKVRKPIHTMRQLAAAANVSVRMLVRLENPGQLADVLRKAQQSPRQCIELARLLANVATAIGIEPKAWIQRAGLSISPEKLQTILREAHSEVKTSLQIDPLGQIQERSGRPEQAEAVFQLKCAQVPYGPFAAKMAETSLSFLASLTEMVVGSIRPDLKIEITEESDFTRVLSGTQYHLILGYLAQLQRAYGSGRWQFAVIPGFRIRMSFLTTPAFASLVNSDWRLLFHPDKTDLRECRLVTMAESAADNLVRGVWLRTLPPTRRPQHERIEAVYEPQELRKKIGEAFRTTTATIFIADEVTADSVRAGLSDDVVDLADHETNPDGAMSAPAYPLGIAAQSSDGVPLSAVFERIIHDELFDANAAIAADLYASYLANSFVDLAKKPALWQRLQKVALQQESRNNIRLPSYMRVIPRTPAWTLSDTFLSELKSGLMRRLRRLHFPVAPEEGLASLVTLFIDDHGSHDLGTTTVQNRHAPSEGSAP